MRTVTEVLLEDAAEALQRRVMNGPEISRSDRAFLAWALHEHFPCDDLSMLATNAAIEFAMNRSYHHPATIGYAAHTLGVDDVQSQALRQGLKWLCGRNPDIAGEPAPFFTDAVALLGLSLGARFLGDDEVVATREWMLSFVPRAIELPAIEAWQRCLFSAALHALGATELTLPEDNSVADCQNGTLRLLSCPCGSKKRRCRAR